MKLNSVLKYLISKLSMMESCDEAGKFLTKNHFVRIGSGCESIVYSRDGFDYVIKLVFDSHFDSGGDHIQSMPSEKHFAESFLVKGFYIPIIIQKKLTPLEDMKKYPLRMGHFRRFISKNWPNISDIASYNIGMDQHGKMYVYDWSDKNFA